MRERPRREGGPQTFGAHPLELERSKDPFNSDKLLQKAHLFKRLRMVKVVGLDNRFFLACGLQNGQ